MVIINVVLLLIEIKPYLAGVDTKMGDHTQYPLLLTFFFFVAFTFRREARINSKLIYYFPRMTRETESNDASSSLFEKHFVENPCLRATHDYVNHKAPQAAG